MEKERNYNNDGLDPSEEYLRKKKKGNDDNYFVGDPEQAYATMKPMLDLLKEQEKNSESKE